MKHTLLFLLTFGPMAAICADVLLNDNGTVTKNGASLNNASDALLNRHITSAEFMAALRAKLDAANAEAADARAALVTLKSQIKDKLDTAAQQLNTALDAAEDETQKAVIAGQIARVKSFQMAAGQSPEQLEVEAKQAAADKAAAELAAAKEKLGQ